VPIVASNPETIDRAARILRGGGVVAFPTETVYGLAANAFDPRAVARIFEIKGRPAFDPLIVHVCDEQMLGRVAADVPPLARKLIERFWPGPLTLVLRKCKDVPELVTSGLPTVGIRMPSHPVARALLIAAGAPLAAPSANPFGGLSPTRAAHVERTLGGSVDMILDGGACERGLESTIVALEPQLALLRPGAIAAEEIESLTGPLPQPVEDETAPLGPGRLAHHYAPRTPLRVVDPATVPLTQRRGAGLLALSNVTDGYARVRLLSPRGDLREAAAALFESLHELDASALSRIDVEPLEERGLGIAMMDRLRRAAAR
jgi:L-threonylcarbamoyladenylate synthase